MMIILTENIKVMILLLLAMNLKTNNLMKAINKLIYKRNL